MIYSRFANCSCYQHELKISKKMDWNYQKSRTIRRISEKKKVQDFARRSSGPEKKNMAAWDRLRAKIVSLSLTIWSVSFLAGTKHMIYIKGVGLYEKFSLLTNRPRSLQLALEQKQRIYSLSLVRNSKENVDYSFVNTSKRLPKT